MLRYFHLSRNHALIAATIGGLSIIIIGVSYSVSQTVQSSRNTGDQKLSVGLFFTKDKKYVYDAGTGAIIEGADPLTFRLCNPGVNNDSCGIDATSLFVDGIRLVGVHQESFKVLNAYYGKDRNMVFLLYGGEAGPLPHWVSNAEARSFVVVNGAYAKDDNRVYLHGISLTPPIDASSFSVISAPYVRDAQHVYLTVGGKVTTIKAADPKTFILLNNRYAKDKTNVYYADKLITGADVKTFRVNLGDGYDAEDKSQKYLEGRTIN